MIITVGLKYEICVIWYDVGQQSEYRDNYAYDVLLRNVALTV
jgi:hypothetical protein